MSLPRLNPVEPPWYGPVCPVVGEGWHREVPPYPDLRRNLAVALRSGEGPFTDPLRTHSSRIANRYFGEFTATPRQAA